MSDDDIEGEGWITIFISDGEAFALDCAPAAAPFTVGSSEPMDAIDRQGMLDGFDASVRELIKLYGEMLATLDALRQDAMPRAGVKPAVSGLLTEAGADHRLGRFH